MKKFLGLILTLTCLISSAVFAHGGAHGSIDSLKALSVAQNAAKTLTFRAMPTEINGQRSTIAKIDKSWAKVKPANFTVENEQDHSFTIKAVNTSISETLYFQVNGEGLLVEVSK